MGTEKPAFKRKEAATSKKKLTERARARLTKHGRQAMERPLDKEIASRNE